MFNFVLNFFYKILNRGPYRPAQYSHAGNEEFKKTHQNKRKLYLKFFVIFGIPALAFGFALFILRIYHIEGPSMEPTLNNDQRVLIQKWDKTWADFKGKKYLPERFDVVVLKLPDEETQIIKRVIGLPGDRVLVDGGSVFITNQQHPEGYLVDTEAPIGVAERDELTEGRIDIMVGEDEVFVLGDNRAFSEDSRSFGAIPTSYIVGQYWNP